MRKVNFNLDSTVNYADLQRQISECIQARLDHEQWTTSSRRYDPQCLNVTFFVREEGDAFLSPRLADRNYLWTKDATGNRLINRFAAVLVPGQWTKERLLKSAHVSLKSEHIFCVGSPRVDLLRRMHEQYQRPTGNGRLRVLWAPTYNGHAISSQRPSVSSYPTFQSNLDRIRDQCDIFVLPHPRHRKEKYATVDELIASDVVVSDVSSVVYEAWALGKPVIFPRWLLGDQVPARFPFSAEARIYQERIGYHAESMDHVLQILRATPTVGEDVRHFMDEYLDNYREGNASAKIADLLLSLAKIGRARKKEHELRAALDHALVRVDSAPDLRALETADRSSIQLLQLQLLNERYQEFQTALMSLRTLLQPSPKLAMALDSLAIEDAILRSDAAAAAVAVSGLRRRYGSPLADRYEARLDLLEGRYDAAFRKAAASVVDVESLQAASPTMVRAAGALRQNELAWTAQEALVRRLPTPEAVAELSLLVSSPDERDRYAAALRDCETKAPELTMGPLTVLSTARAALQTGNGVEARRTLRTFLLQLAGNKSLLAKLRASLLQFDPHSSLPCWSIPFESLPRGRVAPPARRAFTALQHAAAAFRRSSCRAFLIRRSLVAWCARKDEPFLHEEVEFGAFGEQSFEEARRVLAEDRDFAALPSEDRQWTACFKHTNGVKLNIFRHYEAHGEAIHHDGGAALRTRAFSLAEAQRDNLSVLIPADADRYIEDLYTEEQWKHIPLLLFDNGAATVVDEDRFAVRVYVELLRGLIDDDPFLVNAARRMLKRVGEKDFDVAYAVSGNYLRSDLPLLLEDTRFLLHIGDGPNAAFHIDLWFDYCRTADPSVCVVIRSQALFQLLRNTRPELPALHVRSAMQAEWLVNACPQLLGILYPSNTGNTVHFLRFSHLRHIFLGHGDSEKASSCHKFFRAYDEVWTAGQAHVDRFRNSGIDFSSLRFRVVGRPTARPLLKARQRTTMTGRFLYLPTWEGFQAEQNYSSVALVQDFLVNAALCTGKTATLKLHPLTGTQDPKLCGVMDTLVARCESAGVSLSVAGNDIPVADLMADADFLIADVSSVVTDFLCTERPIFLFLPVDRAIRMSMSRMAVTSYCYVFSKVPSLIELVRRVIVDGDDYLQEARSKAAEYYVDLERTEQQQFEAELRNVVREVVGGTCSSGCTEPAQCSSKRLAGLGSRTK